MKHDPVVLARRRLALLAQRDEIDAALKAVDAALIDAVEVGGAIDIDGQPAFRVQQNRPFDLPTAQKVLPAELVALATTTQTVEVVDKDRLKALAEGMGLLDACVKPGRPFVAKAGR